MLETRLAPPSPDGAMSADAAASADADAALPNLPPAAAAAGGTTLTRKDVLLEDTGGGGGMTESTDARVVVGGPGVGGLDSAVGGGGVALVEERSGGAGDEGEALSEAAAAAAAAAAAHSKDDRSSTVGVEVEVGGLQAGPASPVSSSSSSSSSSAAVPPAGLKVAEGETVEGRRRTAVTAGPSGGTTATGTDTGALAFTPPASGSPTKTPSSPPPPPSSPLFSPNMAPLLSSENPALDNLFRVFLVFQEMRSRGVRPDLRAYNALVNTCADLGEFDRALGVVRQMVDDDHGGGLQPDAVTYTSLIKAAARATPPRVKEAEEVCYHI